MSRKVLFVDDEPLVLDGYKRMLHTEFMVSTAVGGEKGLNAIQDNGPYAVVISDMRMPGMNGAQFLAQVREKTPDTVRMLLTGYSDVAAAIDAVNEGHIFRYLTKPCEKQVLVAAINIGIVQYHSVIAERELLQKAQALESEQSIKLSHAELEIARIGQVNNFESPIGLPGPAEARKHLVEIFGVDMQCYIVLFKLMVLQTLELRYGDEAVHDYQSFLAQFLTQALRAEDRLYHWDQDVMMAVIRRKLSPAAMRMEILRITSGTHDYMINANGRCSMITSPLAFEILTGSEFLTFDDMLAAIEARLSDKL